jgi:glucokinase
MYHLGIDLGGTNIAAAVVDDNYKIVGTGKVKTNCPRPADEIADDIYKAGLLAIENSGLSLSDIAEVGVGSPGSVNSKIGYICYAGNLGFHNVPLKAMLEERFGREVYLENDANAAAFGEQLAGAGKGADSFIAITLGTGVGGGVIENGRILSGANSAGGELGHIVIIMNGDSCTCGRNGCWEAYASATALIKQTKEAMELDKNSKLWDVVGGNIEEVNGKTAFDGMRLGDKTATDVVNKYCEYVACGITNIINIFQPDVLCIGGGISKEGETLVTPVRNFVERERFSRNVEKQTEIKTAVLGNDAGIIGAAFLGTIYGK